MGSKKTFLGNAVEKINSLGFVEVYGLIAGIEASDAMLKCAKVRLLREHETVPGMVTVVVEGDLAACQAAVNAGVAAASKLGKVFGSLIIPRPDKDTGTLVLDLVNGKGIKAPGMPAATPTVSDVPTPSPKEGVAESNAGSNEQDLVVDFVCRAVKGRTLNEITKKFPQQAQHMSKTLTTLVQAGKISKVGGRYQKPNGKE